MRSQSVFLDGVMVSVECFASFRSIKVRVSSESDRERWVAVSTNVDATIIAVPPRESRRGVIRGLAPWESEWKHLNLSIKVGSGMKTNETHEMHWCPERRFSATTRSRAHDDIAGSICWED